MVSELSVVNVYLFLAKVAVNVLSPVRNKVSVDNVLPLFHCTK